ncbi:pyridoxal phosphate-dependent aminotransferase [Agromyces sp. SYSU T00194]|uniref:pyridoxal phosphate-dependent aminotransferase n=1 Tax=Agromyces chitinivorans TaxID=3158560 RepID=UPI003392DBCF
MSAGIGEYASHVGGSGIREIVNLVVARPPGEIDRLEIGEPDFTTPVHITEAAMRRALDGVGYTQSAGLAELRTLLARRLHEASGLDYHPDDVIVTAGGVQACQLVMAATLSPGDEVLVPDPAWPNYEMLATLAGARAVHYPLPADRGFVADPAEIAALITDRTRLLVLNSPGNPTGAVFPPAVVREIVEVCAARDVLVLSDEVYDELIFDGTPANAIGVDRDHVIGVYSFSKTYAMTGWRVGYVASPSWLAPTLWRVQEPLVSCVSEVSQAAAMAALTGPREEVDAMRESYRRRRDLVVGLLRAEGIEVVVPDGAFYVMVSFAAGVDSRRACIELVERGVSLAPGTAFGSVAASFARISLSASEPVLRRGLARLASWYRETEGGARPALGRVGAVTS